MNIIRPLTAVIFSLWASTAAFANEVSSLREALPLVASQKWAEALAVTPEGIARDIVLWSMLREGEGRLGDYEDFIVRRADWPGMPLLQRKGEEAVARSITPSRVINYFGKREPATAEGAIALVGALQATGQVAAAETVAMRAWVNLSFTVDQEAALQALAPEAMRASDSERLENLLWEGRTSEASRMLRLVSPDYAALARARIALRSEAQGVDDLIAAVPAALRDDAGLSYERFIWRMRKDLYDGASEVLLAQKPEKLGRPEAWAPRRALLTRWLIRQDRAAEAYKIAAAHGLSRGGNFADLEFLAGFIALQKLKEPRLALQHFMALRSGVSTPISTSRADYWLGRAAEALGQKERAEGYYLEAARQQTAYYGLLSGEKLGLFLNPQLLGGEASPDWRSQSFAQSSVLAAGRMLLQAGDLAQGKRFLLHLAESQDANGLAALAGMAKEMGEPHVAVLIAKQAAERGIVLPEAYFPIPEFVPDGLAISRALALAIARRESEFDPRARSHANAQGLMQVLPETAERMARQLGLDYAPGKLMSDPAFNVTVGSAYLAKMVEEFGPSVALIASGYNAGPGRPRRWINELGDPRLPSVDVVDWVETIPFAETRTYVMRVVEGLVIYRAKLKGEAGPIRITPELKG